MDRPNLTGSISWETARGAGSCNSTQCHSCWLLHTRRTSSPTYCTHTLQQWNKALPWIGSGIQWLDDSSTIALNVIPTFTFSNRFLIHSDKNRASWLPGHMYFSSFHGTPELLHGQGVLSGVCLNFLMNREVHSETWESCRGQNLHAGSQPSSAHAGDTALEWSPNWKAVTATWRPMTVSHQQGLLR